MFNTINTIAPLGHLKVASREICPNYPLLQDRISTIVSGAWVNPMYKFIYKNKINIVLLVIAQRVVHSFWWLALEQMFFFLFSKCPLFENARINKRFC